MVFVGPFLLGVFYDSMILKTQLKISSHSQVKFCFQVSSTCITGSRSICSHIKEKQKHVRQIIFSQNMVSGEHNVMPGGCLLPCQC